MQSSLNALANIANDNTDDGTKGKEESSFPCYPNFLQVLLDLKNVGS